MRKRPVVAELERHYNRINHALQSLRERIVAAGVAGPALEEENRDRIEQDRSMLLHLSACLELVEPGWKPSSFRHRPKRNAPDRINLLELGYAAMWSKPAQPQTTRELLTWLWLNDQIAKEQAD